MNKKQKVTIVSFLVVSLGAIILWLSFGAEIFTKTQILVIRKDELFGWEKKEWIDKFIWGLDLTGIIILVSFIVSALLYYLFRRKKGELSQ